MKNNRKLIIYICAMAVTLVVLVLVLIFGRPAGGGDDPAASDATTEETAEAVDAAQGSETEIDAEDSADVPEESSEDELENMGGVLLATPFSYTPREYEVDEKGNLVIPEREEGRFEEAPEFPCGYTITGDELFDSATVLAESYDYEAAIELLKSSEGYEYNDSYRHAVADYEDRLAALTEWPDNSLITHIFFHSLIVDTSLTFGEGALKPDAFNEVMTTIDEFVDIISQMYQRGYVLVDIHDVAQVTEVDGETKMRYMPIMLPEGKIPFVLSQDDVSYYDYMSGQGFATKLVIGEDGLITNEYVTKDGETITGAYDVVPILDAFVRAHPDFSYHGAKGTIAFTGYEGVLGYDTNTGDAALIKEAREVAGALKAEGWNFASHSYTHYDMGELSFSRFEDDCENWEREVAPILGDVDVYIYPKGADIGDWKYYSDSNKKYRLLKSYGFNYFCNVDSARYWVQMGPNGEYLRMGRRNIDGTRLWQAVSYYADPDAYDWSEEKRHSRAMDDIIDARTVFDWSRKMPVE